MTIKPVASQKASEKKDIAGHGAESQPSASRGHNHRGILASSETQVRRRRGTSSPQPPSTTATKYQQPLAQLQPSPQRRNDVFDDILRHRRSPHKSGSGSHRSKRGDHRGGSEKHAPGSSPQYHSVHGNSPHQASAPSNKSPKHVHGATMVGDGAGGSTVSSVASPVDLLSIIEEHRDVYSGYNSGDEHLVPKETALTADEWKLRDEQFIKAMAERGFIVQDIVEDGACLFRAISLQIFGDQEMHELIRQQTMDYIYQNREYFAHFVTEDITSYVKRKRNIDSHGNHIEIQAMSEIYNRSVELYCYQTTPTNIFNSEQLNNGYDPLRLSYQRGSHYNAILDPYNASVGVGLGLAGYKPESQTREAIRLSEQQEIEQTMFEDKLKTTDWEATNEAIEEQIARESYLQWCRENSQAAKPTTTTVTRSTASTSTTNTTILSSTITSASMKSSQSTVLGDKENADNDNMMRASMSGGVDSIIMPPTLMETMAGVGVAECYDSDDTDMSSTSHDSMYKDPMQLGLMKKLKFKAAGKRRVGSKRKHRGDAGENGLCTCDNTGPCPHKRAKFIQEPGGNQSSASAVNSGAAGAGSTINTTYDYGGVPGTSKQASQSEKPVSSFYQSLLESSYADDGLAQMTESEMIVKAIRLSRIDYFERVQRQCEKQTTQQEDVIQPMPTNRDICNSSNYGQDGSSSATATEWSTSAYRSVNLPATNLTTVGRLAFEEHFGERYYEDDDSDLASS